ncbi:hypothetical protein P43SY_001926 [Pythium insidiosum]|uniref:DUF4360 domain-containing protein n=1 Tax=Pythium insidiosum TaxID=114742 RepID=A0AAD5MAZ3_PYTIN|nr:hypothetical protein P43SY_001926 [Pythium insidiosum]
MSVIYSALLSALALLLLAATSSQAQDTDPVYVLGKPTVFGSGCPPGSTAVVPSSDGQSVSVMFMSYAASTADGVRVRRACNLAVPVRARPGFSIGFFKVDFRGWAYVPDAANTMARLSNEYFFAGQRGPVVDRVFGRGYNDEIFESNEITIESVVWSECGSTTNFRINTAVTVAKPRGVQDDVQVQIDTADATVDGQVQVYVTYKQCTKE